MNGRLVWRTDVLRALGGAAVALQGGQRHRNATGSCHCYEENDPSTKNLRWETSKSIPETATSSSSTTTRALAHSPTQPFVTNKTTKKQAKQYDFIIIGNGLAGRSAARQLREQCPAASIALIDPLRTDTDTDSSIHMLTQQATFLDPRERIVQLRDQSSVSYKCAVLIATGSHGAPIPHYLHDEQARSRILEWKGQYSQHGKEEALLPDQITSQIVKAARTGQKIAVLGSGWDAVALTLRAASVSRRGRRPTLFTGASGPLSHVLPNYLVNAVAKRIKSKHIIIKDRTLIRYISMEHTTPQLEPKAQVQIYTARSFDFMDSQVDLVDWIVAAPDTSGPRGSASLGTGAVPDHLVETTNERNWFQSWSDMTISSTQDPLSIGCFQEDGRIVVNAELCACHNVYAAGGVAKFPNSFSGHADVAGEGIEDAANAGRVAAFNMSLHCESGQRGGSSMSDKACQTPRTKDPIPIFRSDELTCDGDQGSILTENGINALLLGHCDSERLFTVAVWWTNQAAQRRMLGSADEEEHGTPRRRKSIRESLKPVYGIGIVYYFDRTGTIRGIMTWGMPYTTKQSGGKRLNDQLVDELRHIIRNNGGFVPMDSDVDHLRMTKYLTEVTRKLVKSSLCGYSGNEVDDDLTEFSKPLLRYTQIRRNSIRTGVLKRKDGQSLGVLGEDMFARYRPPIEEIQITKPDMTVNVGYAAKQAQDMYEWNSWKQKEGQWEENEQCARPPREDPLWIRKGDEVRQTSAKDNLLAAFNTALWGHSG